MEEMQKSDVSCQFGDKFCQKPALEDFNKSPFFNPIISEFEKDMKDSLLGKVMENFESTMMKETKKLDDMQRESDLEQARLERERNSQHIPSTLRNDGAKLEELWKIVNDLIRSQKTKNDNSERKANVEILKSDVSKMLLSHCFAAWLSTLDHNHYERFTREIYSEICHWISKIWRFRCSTSLFHNKYYDGVLSVCRVALATHFSKYQNMGYSALFSHNPVIYLHRSSDSSLIDYLQINLGLYIDCFQLVPNNFESTSDEIMDVLSLEELILADIIAGKEPLALIISADCIDILSEINELSRKHNLWLHIEGCQLSELAMEDDFSKVDSISAKVNSMTLDLGKWIGIPSVPFITLVVSNLPEPYLNSLGFGAGYFVHNRTSLNIFPLWLSLQLIGNDGVVHKFQEQRRQTHNLVKHLKDIQGINILSRKTYEYNQETKMARNSIQSKEPFKDRKRGKLSSVALDSNRVPFVVWFRYEPPVDQYSIKVVALDNDDSEDSKVYVNSLNDWLATNLMITYPDMNLLVVDLGIERSCIRISLQDCNIGVDVSDDWLEEFCLSVSEHVTVMNSTLRQRPIFNDLVNKRCQLLHLNLSTWAGLGCVLFIPEMLRNDLYKSSVSDDISIDFHYEELVKILSIQKNVIEINKINKILIDLLRNEDSAFSMGVYDFVLSPSSQEQVSLICIRFGMITNSTTVEQLIDVVVTKGIDVETTNRNLDTMSELVKDGISKVNDQLAMEQEEKLKQQGILRQIPYIDSIVNWMYPPHKNQIKGRSFDLSSGDLQSTDNTYKYKMQLHSCVIPPSSGDTENDEKP